MSSCHTGAAELRYICKVLAKQNELHACTVEAIHTKPIVILPPCDEQARPGSSKKTNKNYYKGAYYAVNSCYAQLLER